MQFIQSSYSINQWVQVQYICSALHTKHYCSCFVIMGCVLCSLVLHVVTCLEVKGGSVWGTLHLLPRHSALSFLDMKGSFPATVEPTVETPPATAETPSFTSPTPIKGTVVTADLVTSRLLPPTQATPLTAAPTTPLVTLNKPPVTRHIMLEGAAGSLPESEGGGAT